MGKHVVMSDVAQHAGVSSQTVSRVLSGKENVSPATRQRVLDAVNKLGYRPDVAAQMLASGTSRAIGVLTIGQLSYGRMLAFSAFERVARAHGHYIIPATITSYQFDELLDAANYLQHTKISSLVIMGQRIDLLQELAAHITVPTVLAVNEYLNIDNVSVVQINQNKATQRLLEHLYDVGARKIAYIGPTSGDVDAVLRSSTYRIFCASNNLPSTLVSTSNWGSAEGAQAAERLLNTASFDAVFAANDHLAIGCAYQLKKSRSLTPGRDYALAGFDDIETAAFQHPPLTTVRQSYLRYADAIFTLLQDLQRTGVTRVETYDAELIIRESTANFKRPQ